MGKPQRDKGLRVERGIVDRFRQAGIPAERVPLSGAAGGNFYGDVRAYPAGGPVLTVEVKGRAVGTGGLARLLRLKGENEALIVKEDGCEPVVITRLDHYLSRLYLSRLQLPAAMERPPDAGRGVLPGHRDGDDRGPVDTPPGAGDGQ